MRDPDRHSVGLFCADQKLLADGRLLAVGGTDYYQDPRIAPGIGALELHGPTTTRVFDPMTDTWQETAPMKFGRWYPSMVTLGDGDMFVASGVTKLIKPVYPHAPEYSGSNVRPTETYDIATNTWARNRGGDRALPLYPRLHVLPNGKVFYDAAGQAFNPMGEAYDEALWNLAAVYDPKARGNTGNTSRWTDLGIPGLGTAAPGFRGSTFSAPLRLDPPYTTARFLTAGGVIGTSPGTVVATADSRISEVTINPGRPETFNTYPTRPLNNARWFSSAVPLPDGTVLALSGADIDAVVAPGYERPIRQAELFVPSANGRNGSWRRLASAKRDRTYHNSAVLLPDGRVLVGGHAPIPKGDMKTENQNDIPGRDFATNFHDASFEIFTPPYATRTDRPTITSFDAVLDRGSSTVIGVGDARSVDSVVLMRNPSTTHVIDGDARSVGLQIIGRDTDAVHVAIPEQEAVLPPGPYYLFVNRLAPDGAILPSVAKQVFVGTPTAPAYVSDPAGNVTYSAKAASATRTPDADLVPDLGPGVGPLAAAPSASIDTRLAHNSGVDDFAAVVVGLGVTVLWLANRGRRQRARDTSHA